MDQNTNQTPLPPPSLSDTEVSHNPIPKTANRYKKILCVEDETFISELYAKALEKAGYEVKVVVDGGEGLKEAKTNQYDIILLDILVPTITGIDLLKKLRDPKEVQDLKAKIIVTTNLEQSEEDRKAVEDQADGYIIKANITPKELAQFLLSLE